MEEAIDGLSELSSWITEFNDASFETGAYVAGALLMIGLIFVVDAMVRSRDNAQKYLLVWFLAVVFTIIVFNG